MHDLFQYIFGYFFKLFIALFIVVNGINSKSLQISRSVINFQGKIPNCRVTSALEKTFQIQALFKNFKDLHEPCE